MFKWGWIMVALATMLVGCGQAADSAGDQASGSGSPTSSALPTDPQGITKAYVEQFYPLWLSHTQTKLAPSNQLLGPDKISPVYQAVVAINDDTLYASTPVELSTEPVVVTIPPTSVEYSILTLSPYGDIFDTGIPPNTPGTFAFTGPDWQGELPDGVTAVANPLDFSILIFRADKYTANGQDLTQAADEFRQSLRLATLSDYINDETAGATRILPEAEFAVPFKTTADALIANDPIAYLSQLQEAVASTNTPPMTAAEQALSNSFNDIFGAADADSNRAPFAAGAQEAHATILNTYLDNRGPTNWITFTNIGDWGDAVVDRSAISEFIQWANGRSTSAYYQAFVDGKGADLDGSAGTNYTVTFPADQIPEAKRFWSLTAYTPEAIELVPNSANKYVVAGYTPGLQKNPDGSLTIHLAAEQPQGVPEANWLPTPRGPFNIMLRVYGPEGSVADNTYVPPAVAMAPAETAVPSAAS